MKRFLTCLLVAVLCVACIAPTAFAAEPATVTVSSMTVPESYAGKTVELNVTADVPVAAYGMYVIVDSKLGFDGTGDTEDIVNTGALAGFDAYNNKVGAEDSKACAAGTVLFKIRVTIPADAKGGDEYPVSVNVHYVADGDLQKYAVTSIPGKIKISHEHSYDTYVETVAPTCTEQGYDIYKCACGDTTKKNFVDAAHKPGDKHEENRVEATCTVAGGYDLVVRCTVCNEVISSEHKVLTAGHKMDGGVTVDPTCTEDGYILYTCSVCGHTEKVANGVAALGHKWDKGVETKKATCTEPGEMTYTCERCKTTKTEPTKALGHKDHYEYDDNYHWFVCERCGRKTDKVKHDHNIEYNGKLYCECGHSIDIPTKPTQPDEDLDDVPETGDITDQVIFGTVATLAALAAAAYVCKRKFAK